MKNINWKSGFKRIVAVVLAVALWNALIDSYDAAQYVSPEASSDWWSLFFDHLLDNLAKIVGLSLILLTMGGIARFIYRGFISQKV